MIDNLLFFNLEERESENCTKVIQNFCKENLRLMEAEHFEFESGPPILESTQFKGTPNFSKIQEFL